MKIKKMFYAVKGKAIKYSPEIFVGAGCAGLIVAGVMACKKTLKLQEIKEKHKDILDQIDEMEENGLADENVEYTHEDAEHDRKLMKVKKAAEYVKLYSIPVGIATVSFASIIWGHKILRKRNAALVAAYTAVDQGFKEYRKRVVERFGEDVDKQLRFNTTPVEEKKKVKHEDGTTETVKTTKNVANGNLVGKSEYARIFYEGNNGWSDCPEDSLLFLTNQMKYFNNLLRAKGYVFLNEVYEALGFKPSKAGQIVGWVYKPEDSSRDNYIDFGIHQVCNDRYLDGCECNVILDFNVDGPIIDYI